MAGIGDTESILLRLCRDTDPEIRLLAEDVLVQGDPAGIHRKLYRELARAGDCPAMEALSFWPDPEAMAILETKPGWDYHRFEGRPADPKTALVRLRAFADGTWEEMAENALLGEWWPHFKWAIRVGLERRPAWFGRVLRELMKKEYASGRFGFLDDGTAYLDGVVVDELLLALSEIGWPLTREEQNYLRAYGYLGDPRERLEDVLNRSGR
ncbi:MAG TPA: hypothetical protein VNM14_26305 [Planctomycetota bacterium]|nr:hypothetical protein [Planctomycetota bacterium]